AAPSQSLDPSRMHSLQSGSISSLAASRSWGKSRGCCLEEMPHGPAHDGARSRPGSDTFLPAHGLKPMQGEPFRSVPNRQTDSWLVPILKPGVLVGVSGFVQGAQAFFAPQVPNVSVRVIPTDHEPQQGLPSGFPVQDPWCLLCDLGTSHRSLQIARKL